MQAYALMYVVIAVAIVEKVVPWLVVGVLVVAGSVSLYRSWRG